MRIKISLFFILLGMCFSCDGVSHDRTTIVLDGFENQKEIIYQTSIADIHISYNELEMYFENNGFIEPSKYSLHQILNDSTQNQIIQYVKSFNSKSIVISDTLATKMIKKDGMLARVEDEKHPNYRLSEDLKLILFEFAYQGKLKVFDKQLNSFVKEIIIDEVETKTDSEPCSTYSEFNITLINKSIILSIFFGCNS